MTPSLTDKIFASLCLAGMGDALGAQTEQWTIDEIAQLHPRLVQRFGTPPPDTFAGANAGKKAEVTDDASQMYYLARALIAADGRLDNKAWVDCLLDWAATSPKASFMGPSTAGIVKALQQGDDLRRVGAIGNSNRKMTTVGNTNGAAMRVAPCGLLHPGDLEAACEQAFITCLPSHDTDAAISAACAIAGGTAMALAGAGLREVVQACVKAAARGEHLGRTRVRTVAGPNVVARIEMALAIAAKTSDSADDMRFMREMEQLVGNSVLAAESVPAAVGVVAYAKGDPMRTIAISASMGNDTDTIATMAGAIVGAMAGPDALPRELLREFLEVNEKEYALQTLAHGLGQLAERNVAARR